MSGLAEKKGSGKRREIGVVRVVGKGGERENDDVPDAVRFEEDCHAIWTNQIIRRDFSGKIFGALFSFSLPLFPLIPHSLIFLSLSLSLYPLIYERMPHLGSRMTHTHILNNNS